MVLECGATGPQILAHVVVPIILPSLVGVALFGFTLSWDAERQRDHRERDAGGDGAEGVDLRRGHGGGEPLEMPGA
jgi:hypothetical protein